MKTFLAPLLLDCSDGDRAATGIVMRCLGAASSRRNAHLEGHFREAILAALMITAILASTAMVG